MRIPSIATLILCLAACGWFKNDRAVVEPRDSGEDPEDFFLFDCDIRCDSDGLDLAIDAVGASTAQVEFFAAAELIDVFDLTPLDDREWVAYPDWPAGTSFADCGAEADFVCVIQNDAGDEIREAR